MSEGMFSQMLDKMTKEQRTAIEALLARDASLEEVLSEPDIISQSQWEAQRLLGD